MRTTSDCLLELVACTSERWVRRDWLTGVILTFISAPQSIRPHLLDKNNPKKTGGLWPHRRIREGQHGGRGMGRQHLPRCVCVCEIICRSPCDAMLRHFMHFDHCCGALDGLYHNPHTHPTLPPPKYNRLYVSTHSSILPSFQNENPTGCGCDVPSHLYSLSFEPSCDWTRMYPAQRGA